MGLTGRPEEAEVSRDPSATARPRIDLQVGVLPARLAVQWATLMAVDARRLAKLTNWERSILIMRCYQDMTQPEIAEHDVSPNKQPKPRE